MARLRRLRRCGNSAAAMVPIMRFAVQVAVVIRYAGSQRRPGRGSSTHTGRFPAYFEETSRLSCPWGGSSGLPREIAAFSGAAVAAVGAVTTPAAAVVANTSRLDIILVYSSGWTKGICAEMDAGRRTKFTDD